MNRDLEQEEQLLAMSRWQREECERLQCGFVLSLGANLKQWAEAGATSTTIGSDPTAIPSLLLEPKPASLLPG